MNTETRESRKERKARLKKEEETRIVSKKWKQIKAATVRVHGKKVKVRQIVRSKANELPRMNTNDGPIDHYDNLKRAICIGDVEGFNNYIELVNKRIKELKQQ